MTDHKARAIQDLRRLWTEREQARETLKYADVAIPNRFAELDAIDPDAAQRLRNELESGSPEETLAPEPAPEPGAKEPAPANNGENDQPAEPRLRKIKLAREVQPAIKAALRHLDGEFTQNDMDAALELDGLLVNRTTLRGNLLELAKLGEGMALVRRGGGRTKPTIFKKVGIEL